MCGKPHKTLKYKTRKETELKFYITVIRVTLYRILLTKKWIWTLLVTNGYF